MRKHSTCTHINTHTDKGFHVFIYSFFIFFPPFHHRPFTIMCFFCSVFFALSFSLFLIIVQFQFVISFILLVQPLLHLFLLFLLLNCMVCKQQACSTPPTIINSRIEYSAIIGTDCEISFGFDRNTHGISTMFSYFVLSSFSSIISIRGRFIGK